MALGRHVVKCRKIAIERHKLNRKLKGSKNTGIMSKKCLEKLLAKNGHLDVQGFKLRPTNMMIIRKSGPPIPSSRARV